MDVMRNTHKILFVIPKQKIRRGILRNRRNGLGETSSDNMGCNGLNLDIENGLDFVHTAMDLRVA
jgi:hypothetical protein